jgi:hypothetical protein
VILFARPSTRLIYQFLNNQYLFVDHDKAARHVFKQNHCCNHNASAPIDLIQYVEYSDFEAVEKNLDNILKENRT